MHQQTLDIFINNKANRNTAGLAWEKISPALHQQGYATRVWPVESRERLSRQVAEAMTKGGTRLIAAGGDGTLQSLLDAVLTQPSIESRQESISLGAIGIGTSNDFHKPAAPERLIADYPCRIRDEGAALNDVVELSGETATGDACRHFFLQASHAGTIPETNDRLTSKPGFFKNLYHLWYGLALPLAALYTLIFYPGFEGEIHVAREQWKGNFSGLTILKRPHIAGQFVFATKRTSADGLVDMALCSKVGAFRMIQITEAFQKQGFGGHPEVVFKETNEIRATFSTPQSIDYDGELITLRQACWRVHPLKIRILS